MSDKSSKGAELSTPVDPNSEPTGNTIFVLSEIYETPAGVAEHWRAASASRGHDVLIMGVGHLMMGDDPQAVADVIRLGVRAPALAGAAPTAAAS